MAKKNKQSFSANKSAQNAVNLKMAAHILLGLGLGVLLTYPIVGAHPLRWGIVFLTLGIIAYAYPQMAKK